MPCLYVILQADYILLIYRSICRAHLDACLSMEGRQVERPPYGQDGAKKWAPPNYPSLDLISSIFSSVLSVAFYEIKFGVKFNDFKIRLDAKSWTALNQKWAQVSAAEAL